MDFPVGRYHTADKAMIKREGTELLRDEDNRETLALIGTEGAGGHDHPFSKAERNTEVI